VILVREDIVVGRRVTHAMQGDRLG
jgi:hypothetical protein